MKTHTVAKGELTFLVVSQPGAHVQEGGTDARKPQEGVALCPLKEENEMEPGRQKARHAGWQRQAADI